MSEKESNDTAPKSIDWRHVHDRIEAFQLVLERGSVQTREEKAKILKARAGILSQAIEEEKTDAEFIEVVAFTLAYEEYALESSHVREVYPMRELTPVPGAPPFVLGIINVRGQILSVVDIKKFFDLPEKGLTDLNKVIIIHNDKMEFGVLADVVIGTRSIMMEDIQPSIPGFTGIRAQYLKGVTGERMVLLDAANLLSDTSILVREGMQWAGKG
jgi:purine-binding chemotaxis protein CheW